MDVVSNKFKAINNAKILDKNFQNIFSIVTVHKSGLRRILIDTDKSIKFLYIVSSIFLSRTTGPV